MDNDRAFAIYISVIVGGLACVLATAVAVGITEIPAPLVFVEHVALGLLFRAAYKSLGGPAWWPYPEHAEEAAVAVGVPDAVIGGASEEELPEAA